MGTVNLGVLASGAGTNLQALIDRIQAGSLAARIVAVLSDRPEAQALDRAQRHGLFHQCVRPARFIGKAEFESELIRLLKSQNVELVALAGFMKLLSPTFIRAFPGRIMNIHPSLLPAFPGLHGIRQAYEHKVKVTGCTVHFVDEGVDSGPIIIQAALPILESDTEASLEERIHGLEHAIFPEAIQLFAEGRLRIEGRRVRILNASDASEGFCQPTTRFRPPGGV